MKIAILGSVGVPGNYGGFETLAENLVLHHSQTERNVELTVWCSRIDNKEHPSRYESAELRYIALRANGVQSILYDAISLWQALRSKHNRILLLGVSAALSLPIIRLFSKARIVTNIDGIEWRRQKWNAFARAFLRVSEWAAVRFSHQVIADNDAIAAHVRDAYNSACQVIAYGGDHALATSAEPDKLPRGLPEAYALALCRIEPENNAHLILEAFSRLNSPLVFVGNWKNSTYGRSLLSRYANRQNLHLLDPIYDPGALRALRDRAETYIHGHSAGGTNPSLVEMMHFGVPVLAYDCIFNRHTTDGRARYFTTSNQLAQTLLCLSKAEAEEIGSSMREIARGRYTWCKIANAYFKLLEKDI